MIDRLNKQIIAHQGNPHQQVEPKQSSQIQPTEQNKPKNSSEINNAVEMQPESVTKIPNFSQVNVVTIAGEVIFFSLIITPIALTWLKSRVS